MSNKTLISKSPNVKVQVVIVEIKDIDGDSEANYTDLVGVFYTKKTAEAGLVAWVLKRWEDSESEPWIDEDDESEVKPKVAKAEYLKDHTNADILAEYFDDEFREYNIYGTIVRS